MTSSLTKLYRLGGFTSILKKYSKTLCTNVSTPVNAVNNIILDNRAKRMPKVSGMAYLVDQFLTENPHIIPLINEVTKLGISEYQFANVIRKMPEIMDYDYTTAASCVRALHEYGFDNESIVTMIVHYPKMLRLHYNDIEKSMETWRASHLGERFLLRLFTDYPHLFDMDDELVRKRLHYLKHHMAGKLGRVTNLILNCPQILYSNWYQTEYKLNYLLIKMGTTEKQIAESKVLSYPISHIKLRHSFLEKTGIYKTPNPKDKGFSPHRNPPLMKIVDTNDYTFACNVARVSLDEYEVYKKLCAYMEEETEAFDDDKDDEETSDEEDSGEESEDDTYNDYRERALDD